MRHAYGALLDEIVAKAHNVRNQFTFLLVEVMFRTEALKCLG